MTTVRRGRSALSLIGYVVSAAAAAGSLACAVDSSARPLAGLGLATCLPPRMEPPGNMRSWDTTVFLRDGMEVRVRAASEAGGNAVVFYPKTGETYVAADPHDYIYPTDVRFSSEDGVLYVVAQGLAAGISQQTWLFAFDLRERRQTARLKIDAKRLPERCSGGQ